MPQSVLTTSRRTRSRLGLSADLARAGSPAARAAVMVNKLSNLRPELGFVLGSGFQHLLEEMEVVAQVPYRDLPGFPAPGVAGHAGQMLVGRVGGVPACVLSGRAHFYEGHSMQTVTLAVRTLAALGVKVLLLTNAAGGINSKFRAGDFMGISDHINLTGDNPLCGEVIEGLTRFVDLSQAYDLNLQACVKQAAKVARIRLHSGVYLAVRGPSYETPAEIRAFKCLGADAVGMSTVPETIVARQLGLRVAGISCITNLAAGRSKVPLSHAEVLEAAVRVKQQGSRLLAEFARLYGESHPG